TPLPNIDTLFNKSDCQTTLPYGFTVTDNCYAIWTLDDKKVHRLYCYYESQKTGGVATCEVHNFELSEESVMEIFISGSKDECRSVTPDWMGGWSKILESTDDRFVVLCGIPEQDPELIPDPNPEFHEIVGNIYYRKSVINIRVKSDGSEDIVKSVFDALEKRAKELIDEKTIAKIEIDPDYGPPDSEVDLTGDNFDPDEDVEIRWDTDDGTQLTTVRANTTGGFRIRITIPRNAQDGQHTIYAVSNRGVRATTTFVVGAIEVHGTVSARLKGGLPLQGVAVSLEWMNPIGVRSTLGNTITDEQGKYRISSPDLRVPMPGQLLLRVTLREDEFDTYTVTDDTASDANVQALFGMHGEIGAKPDNTSTWFTINTSGDLE
ncbi:MAG: carboxypeptidase regulatory-like domain-containing protein, partial [Candidatus Pacebacteria bacterium]|nr:carboxypeptidase regulatory-like domain-containing protein [Candidatus Paceibacterota bacterium]